MYLSKIHIENFKGIKSADFTFSRSMNLIIGNNGTGKTSVLEAIAVSLGGFLAGIDGVKTIHFSKDEIRQETQLMGEGSNNIVYKTPILVQSSIEINKETYPFTRQKKSISSSRTTVEPRDICKAANQLATDSSSILPLISYQSFSRISNQKKDKWEDPFSTDFSRVVGYTDCLEEASNTKMLTNWCKRMEQIAWQKDKKIAEYEAVKTAVSKFMQEMLDNSDINIFYDKRTEELMYSNNLEILPVRFLSSGFRTLLGMVLDIAYRMAVLNPNLLNNIVSSTPGIVLIDEIDMHLHPTWQWKVVKALKETFPKVQFIATTHSPIVISSCKNENLINLKPYDLFLDDPSEVCHQNTVMGWQVDDVLKEYMNTSDRDPETSKKLLRISHLAKKKLSSTITDSEYTEYRSLIKELSLLLPQNDIAVEEAALLSIDEMLEDL